MYRLEPQTTGDTNQSKLVRDNQGSLSSESSATRSKLMPLGGGQMERVVSHSPLLSLVGGPQDVTESPVRCLLALPARHGVSEAEVDAQ
jgi:hypothetical protein